MRLIKWWNWITINSCNMHACLLVWIQNFGFSVDIYVMLQMLFKNSYWPRSTFSKSKRPIYVNHFVLWRIFVGCDAMQPNRSFPAFWRNILLPFSGQKNELKDGDCILLLTISKLLPYYTASYPKIMHSSSHCYENLKSHILSFISHRCKLWYLTLWKESKLLLYNSLQSHQKIEINWIKNVLIMIYLQ
jgi:hypothetical protein